LNKYLQVKKCCKVFYEQYGIRELLSYTTKLGNAKKIQCGWIYGEIFDPFALKFRDRSFTFLFVYMVYYIDGFSYVEPSLHPWDEAYLIVVDDFSDMVLDSICQYFIEYFIIYVHEGYRMLSLPFG
ncbi:hypothetical protein H671_5g13768, partial [Cricetulus griseus]